jgi:hypothetical protein
VNDILIAGSAFLKTGTNCLFAAVSAAAQTQKMLVTEGAAANATPLLEYLRSENTTGSSMVYFERNDDTATVGSTVIATGAFNGSMNALFITDDGSRSPAM